MNDEPPKGPCIAADSAISEANTQNAVLELPKIDYPVVSIIIPVYNASKYLDECLESVLLQTYRGHMQVCMYDDSSDDDSWEVMLRWQKRFLEVGFSVECHSGKYDSDGQLFAVIKRKGCGGAKNTAMRYSTGEYICFLDADDAMHPDRVQEQWQSALMHPGAIIGANHERIPKSATIRYTNWANSLTDEQLVLHQFREVTVLQPTWFMSRKTFELVGGYDENIPNTPEDLIFFHKHLRLGGSLAKVPRVLLYYRYHDNMTSKQIHRLKLFKIRLREFQDRVLKDWEQFSIWGVGRDGRKFFMSLDQNYQERVVAFCDVDENVIGTSYVNCWTQQRVPIIKWCDVKPPFVTCVALDRTKNVFENNVKSLGLIEGQDYWHFN